MKEKNIQLLKWVICFYVSLGVLIILAVIFVCFVLPVLSPDRAVSSATLDLLEKVLLWWGIILLPFLKIAETYLHRRKHEKDKN
jgi:hypothetical protein